MTTYRVNSKNSLDNNYGGASEKTSEYSMDNGLFRNVFSVEESEKENFEDYLDNDDGVTWYEEV